MASAWRATEVWPADFAEARRIQEKSLSAVSVVPPQLKDIRFVAGADVSCARGDDRVYAAVVLYDLELRSVLETATATMRAAFPYVPGYLSFREGPSVLAAFDRLSRRPDAAIFDGHGAAHPRRFGLACHIGLLLDLPAVGCAKKVLVGDFKEPPSRKGGRSDLVHNGETVGAALRTRAGVKCVFVSCGHRMVLDTAAAIILKAVGSFRLPEPIRAAHAACNEMRRNYPSRV